ncbi:hypothetical protein JKY79_02560 [Candidatus Babeliales bacterium]|nr:hypothetical protein [Candidatus Babeliales bacterium]
MMKKHILFLMLWGFLYSTFIVQEGLCSGTMLFFLWISFWILYTPFFLRHKKAAHTLYSLTLIKAHYWPLLIWLLSLLYNFVLIGIYPLLYQETFITSSLSLLLMNQFSYWPLLACCLAKLLYHFLIDSLVAIQQRFLLHHVGNLFLFLYVYLFFHWCYADFVVLLAVRGW